MTDCKNCERLREVLERIKKYTDDPDMETPPAVMLASIYGECRQALTPQQPTPAKPCGGSKRVKVGHCL